MTSKFKTTEINAGSLADIAFLLLIFFLITTTISSETGILTKLPPMENSTSGIKAMQRNLLEVRANKNNQLLVNNQLVSIDELKAITIDFLRNENHDKTLPEFKHVAFKGLGEVPVSKQVISVQNDRETDYNTYISIRNELLSAYHQVRNEIAIKHYNQTFDELIQDNNTVAVNNIKKILPQRISEAEPIAME